MSNSNKGDPLAPAMMLLLAYLYMQMVSRSRRNNPKEYDILGIMPAYAMTGFMVFPFFIISLFVPPLGLILLPALPICYIASKVIYNKRKRRILAER